MFDFSLTTPHCAMWLHKLMPCFLLKNTEQCIFSFGGIRFITYKNHSYPLIILNIKLSLSLKISIITFHVPYSIPYSAFSTSPPPPFFPSPFPIMVFSTSWYWSYSLRSAGHRNGSWNFFT